MRWRRLPENIEESFLFLVKSVKILRTCQRDRETKRVGGWLAGSGRITHVDEWVA